MKTSHWGSGDIPITESVSQEPTNTLQNHTTLRVSTFE